MIIVLVIVFLLVPIGLFLISKYHAVSRIWLSAGATGYVAFMALVFSTSAGERDEKLSTYYSVTANVLNIRKGPGKHFGIIGSLKKGNVVLVDTVLNEWAFITTNKKIKGYVSKDFLASSDRIPLAENEENNSWDTILMIGSVGIFIYILYKILSLFGLSNEQRTSTNEQRTSTNGQSTSTNGQSTSTKSVKNEPQHKSPIYFVEIRKGNVGRIKEGSLAFDRVYSSGDAVDSDLENGSLEKTRFLVVTSSGDVFLCNTNGSGRDCVYRKYLSKGAAYKARFFGDDAFIFHTDKGVFKGYFKNSRIDRYN